ncbi:hypothetical protein QR680_019102 [Steinernema hermaphroditum]|uniref:Uncharacterized protein n=1 Tax=Steinernema hermaphroditum TaxID=289476 RepID=A0AA39HM84_9BILA|nr:hypothetical protein QR680_019102 [Steinernema hermaphroditum]
MDDLLKEIHDLKEALKEQKRETDERFEALGKEASDRKPTDDLLDELDGTDFNILYAERPKKAQEIQWHAHAYSPEKSYITIIKRSSSNGRIKFNIKIGMDASVLAQLANMTGFQISSDNDYKTGTYTNDEFGGFKKQPIAFKKHPDDTGFNIEFGKLKVARCTRKHVAMNKKTRITLKGGRIFEVDFVGRTSYILHGTAGQRCTEVTFRNE